MNSHGHLHFRTACEDSKMIKVKIKEKSFLLGASLPTDLSVRTNSSLDPMI
jgi:hypothetical protein